MSRGTLTILAIAGFVGLIAANSTLYTVHQSEQALVLEISRPVRIVQEPGLHAKVPFIQNVVMFDRRLLELTVDQKEMIASDQKRLIVDAFVRYRVVDPLKFYQAVGDERIMRSRLNSIVESSLRQVLGSVPLSVVLSAERSRIMADVTRIVNGQTMGTLLPSGVPVTPQAQPAPVEGQPAPTTPEAVKPTHENAGFGVEVVDVRLMRADLPNENSQAIFRRMQTEREREAKEFRAQGEEEAQRIRSRAEAERTVLLANAEKQAQILRGEGDADSIKIFAAAFNKDADFYSFYRSLQSYRKMLNKDDTTVILSPNSELMKYLNDAH